MTSQSLNLPYLLLAGAILVAIVFGFTIFQPQVQELQAKQGEIEQLQLSLMERQNFLRTLDSKLAELELNREHEAKLQIVLPNEERMEDALRVVHVAATTSGVTVLQVTNATAAVQSETRAKQSRGEAVSAPAGAEILGLKIDFRGPYQGLRAFLQALERSPRLMDVYILDLHADEQAPDLLQGSFTLRLYMIGEGGNI